MDKDVPTQGVAPERAVGLRLTFRQPPPIDCFSNQFLSLPELHGSGHGVPDVVAPGSRNRPRSCRRSDFISKSGIGDR